jgi:hypothetical protein
MLSRAPRIANLGIGWGLVSTLTPRPRYPSDRRLGGSHAAAENKDPSRLLGLEPTDISGAHMHPRRCTGYWHLEDIRSKSQLGPGYPDRVFMVLLIP